MNRLLVIVSTIALAAVIVAGFAIALDRLPTSAPPTSTTRAAPDEQGYPPPPPPTPGPTATPDSGGYLPPPPGVPTAMTTLAGSPYGDLLVPLQAALDQRDAAAVVARVSDGRFLLKLFDVERLYSEGGATLASTGAQSLLETYFDLGAAPLVQGYFATVSPDTGVACLNVMLHAYPAPVPFPTPEATDATGPAPPEAIDADAASWNLCRDQQGQWIWDAWVYGDYDQLVATYAGEHPDGGPYYVVRP